MNALKGGPVASRPPSGLTEQSSTARATRRSKPAPGFGGIPARDPLEVWRTAVTRGLHASGIPDVLRDAGDTLVPSRGTAADFLQGTGPGGLRRSMALLVR